MSKPIFWDLPIRLFHWSLVTLEAFAAKAVKSKADCFACHADAVTGRFDGHAIRIPKE